MSRKPDWRRADQQERDKPEFKPRPVFVPSGVGFPATAKQLACIRYLDPTIPEERLATLDKWEASAVISRLFLVARAPKKEPHVA